MYSGFFKRFFDFSVSLIFLMIILPLMILLTLILSIVNHGNPFFLQTRPGENSKLFHVIKYKTMNDRRAPDGKLLPDSDRLTSIGKILRKTSLDELPQLINIIKGDMSLVGPRPLLTDYLALYNSRQSRRHEVRPGITGWAQVNGRNTLSWEDRFELDVWYVDNLSFSLDIKILYLTAIKVIKREGVNSINAATMDRFTGSRHEKNTSAY